MLHRCNVYRSISAALSDVDRLSKLT